MEHLSDPVFGAVAKGSRSVFRTGKSYPWYLAKNADTDTAESGKGRITHERAISRGPPPSGVRANGSRPQLASPHAGAGGLGEREVAVRKEIADRVRRAIGLKLRSALRRDWDFRLRGCRGLHRQLSGELLWLARDYRSLRQALIEEKSHAEFMPPSRAQAQEF